MPLGIGSSPQERQPATPVRNLEPTYHDEQDDDVHVSLTRETRQFQSHQYNSIHPISLHESPTRTRLETISAMCLNTIPRRLSRALSQASPLNFFRHPVVIMFIITFFISLLSTMYSMGSFKLTPSQAIPEFIPQAAIITVPETNITLAGRPAAFGPHFPEKKINYWTGEEEDALHSSFQTFDTDIDVAENDHSHHKRSFSHQNGKSETEDDSSDDIFDSDDMFYYAKEYTHLYDNVREKQVNADSASTYFASDSADDETVGEGTEQDDSLFGLMGFRSQLVDLMYYLQSDSGSVFNSESDGFTGVLGVVDGSACADPGFEDYDISDKIFSSIPTGNEGDAESENPEFSVKGKASEKYSNLPPDTSMYSNIRGKVALVERGDCSFYQKVLVLQRHGAVAVIVGDNIYRRGLVTMYSTMEPDLVKIPSVFVSKESYDVLKDVVQSWKDEHGSAPPDDGPSDEPGDSDENTPKPPVDGGDFDGPLVTISTVHANGSIMGPALFLLISPLCSLSIIYGIMLFHRRYKRIQERAPKWVVDSLPKRIWVDPMLNSRNSNINNINNGSDSNGVRNKPVEGSDRGAVLDLLEEGEPGLENRDLPENSQKRHNSSHRLLDIEEESENESTIIQDDDEEEDWESLADEPNELDTLLASPKPKLKRKCKTGPKHKGKGQGCCSKKAAQSESTGTTPESSSSASAAAMPYVSTTSVSSSSSPQVSTTIATEEADGSTETYEKIWVSAGECIICLEDYESGVSTVLRLPCDHDFHEHCIRKWLLTRKKTCPICKMDITVNMERKMGKFEKWRAKFSGWMKDIRDLGTLSDDD